MDRDIVYRNAGWVKVWKKMQYVVSIFCAFCENFWYDELIIPSSVVIE